MESTKTGQLGSVLVTGGCDFVGFHIVRHFLSEPSCTSVSVISRNPKRNRLPNVSYYAGDVSDLFTMRTLIRQICPSIIVHAACPTATIASAKEFELVTIQGTRNLLTVASEIESVKAFIFTSSATMAAGPEHINLSENTALADTSPESHPYAKTKAQADKMVLETNSPGIRTASIRLPLVYGERDLIAIPAALRALEKGQARFQLGDGSNLWSFASADNAASAHVLLTRRLMAPNGPKVDGEAFNITDGQSHLFWDFPRTVWKAAGHEVDTDQVWVLPTWAALKIAFLMEWLFWIFTLGVKRPGQLSKQQVELCCFTHTYCIDKAKERLGYAPTGDFSEGIHQAVAWLSREGLWTSAMEKKKRQ